MSFGAASHGNLGQTEETSLPCERYLYTPDLRQDNFKQALCQMKATKQAKLNCSKTHVVLMEIYQLMLTYWHGGFRESSVNQELEKTLFAN